MATTKVKSIKTRLDRTIKYILNSNKTDNLLYTGGFNCTPNTAIERMYTTKSRFNKNDGRLGYHLIQSFKPNEVTPDIAFNIASKFAIQYLSDRYEVAFSTHVDKNHVHNHIVWNSVSCIDGYKYHADKNEYINQIRRISDELCRDNNLSVITPGESESVNMHYAEWQAMKQGKTTWRDIIRKDIDTAIDHSYDLGTFLMQMNDMGYLYKKGQYLSFKCYGMQRYIRLRSLGKGYTDNDISARLAGKEISTVIQNFKKFSNRVYTKSPPKRYKGFQSLLWHYKYLLGLVKKNEHKVPMSEQMKKDLITFDKMVAIFNASVKYNIKNNYDIEVAKKQAISTLEQLMIDRKSIPVQNRDVINLKIRSLRKELKTINTMKEEIPRIKKTLEPITLQKQDRDKIKRNIIER